MSFDDLDPGRADDADGADVEEVQFGSSRSRRRRGPPTILAGIGAVIVAVALIRSTHSSPQPPAVPPPVSTPASTSPDHPPPLHGPVRAAPPLTARVVVPLLGITAGWELYGRGPGAVVRIQFARGFVTWTSVPTLRSTGPVSFVVGPRGAVIRPLDEVPGYVVRDGHFVQRLHAALSHGGLTLPGPRPGQLWVQTRQGANTSMSLVSQRGIATGSVIRLPSGALPAIPDGRGYFLMTDANGVYDAGPAGLHRVTTADVQAVGPTRWLIRECLHAQRCTNVVIDPLRGTRGVLNVAVDEQVSQPIGVISPDGRFAAVPDPHGTAPATLRLIDLDTGTTQAIGVTFSNRQAFDSELAWSPDSQWLFVATARGKVVAIHSRTGRTQGLGVSIPPVNQLVVRPAPA